MNDNAVLPWGYFGLKKPGNLPGSDVAHPHNYVVVKGRNYCDRACYELYCSSGPEDTMAINLAGGAILQLRKHKFSTKCPLMDRPVPTLCIEALLREASNGIECRC